MFYYSRFSFVVVPDHIAFPVAEWTGETLGAVVHTFSASLCFLCSFFCLFLHPVDILCPHIFFLAFCFSQATLAILRPREGHAALHSMVFLECKCRGRRKSSEIVCVCLCIMHEMKSAATHTCISEIESVGPQLVGCLPKMGRGSFLMGSCTVGNNTMLNAIIKRN